MLANLSSRPFLIVLDTEQLKPDSYDPVKKNSVSQRHPNAHCLQATLSSMFCEYILGVVSPSLPWHYSTFIFFSGLNLLFFYFSLIFTTIKVFLTVKALTGPNKLNSIAFPSISKMLISYYYLNISDVCANLILRPLSLALFAPDEADPEVWTNYLSFSFAFF